MSFQELHINPPQRRRRLLALAAAAAIVVPFTASAGVLDSETAAKLDVELTGQVSPKCEITGGGGIDFNELIAEGAASSQLDLGCNVPFDLRLQSGNGALTHVSSPQGEGPFAGALPYTLELTAPTLSPHPSVLHGAFTSQQLRGGVTLSSGDAIASGPARIEVRTAAPGGAGLLAGAYAERFTVMVIPRI